jgi:hypothetical protein
MSRADKVVARKRARVWGMFPAMADPRGNAVQTSQGDNAMTFLRNVSERSSCRFQA